jgi:hypothetical protein
MAAGRDTAGVRALWTIKKPATAGFLMGAHGNVGWNAFNSAHSQNISI